MQGALSALADWAASVREVPGDTLDRARQQHLSAAAVIRAVRKGASWAALGGAAGGAATQAGALWLSNADDWMLSGRPSPGGIPAAWAGATAGLSLGELLTATVVANEVAGRIGLALALLHRPDAVDVRVARVAAAVVRARLAGSGAAAMNAAITGSLVRADPVGLADVATPSGARAVGERVLGGGTASGTLGTDSLSASGGPELAGALGALGSTWLTRTLRIKRWPGTPWGNVAIDAVNVILGRHLHASEKRLRPDQVDRIEIRTAFGPACTESAAAQVPGSFAAAWSIAEAVALLVAHHDLGPEWLEEGASGEKSEDVRSLVPKVAIIHDWKLSVREAVAMARALGPVLGEAGVRRVLSAGKPLVSGRPSAEALLPMVNEHPWEIVGSLRREGGLEAIDVGAFSWCFPVEVKLYTTRGGWWPERRAEGSTNEQALTTKWGAGLPAITAAATDTPAKAWVEGLLA